MVTPVIEALARERMRAIRRDAAACRLASQPDSALAPVVRDVVASETHRRRALVFAPGRG